MGVLKKPVLAHDVFIDDYGFETTKDGYQRCFKCLGGKHYLWVTIPYELTRMKYRLETDKGETVYTASDVIPPKTEVLDIINMLDDAITDILEDW